jgi:hypothetical protein
MPEGCLRVYCFAVIHFVCLAGPGRGEDQGVVGVMGGQGKTGLMNGSD